MDNIPKLVSDIKSLKAKKKAIDEKMDTATAELYAQLDVMTPAEYRQTVSDLGLRPKNGEAPFIDTHELSEADAKKVLRYLIKTRDVKEFVADAMTPTELSKAFPTIADKAISYKKVKRSISFKE